MTPPCDTLAEAVVVRAGARNHDAGRNQLGVTLAARDQGNTMRATSLLLVIGAAFASMPMATTAQTIYKCTTGSSTTYQDSPCTGAGVKSSKLSLDTANAAPSGARTTTTTTTAKTAPDTGEQQTLRAITSQQQILNTQIRAEGAFMRAEMDSARHRTQGQSPDARRAAVTQVHDKWWPGIQAKEAQAKQLTDAVRRLCPGGAMVNSKHAVCLHD